MLSIKESVENIPASLLVVPLEKHLTEFPILEW